MARDLDGTTVKRLNEVRGAQAPLAESADLRQQSVTEEASKDCAASPPPPASRGSVVS